MVVQYSGLINVSVIDFGCLSSSCLLVGQLIYSRLINKLVSEIKPNDASCSSLEIYRMLTWVLFRTVELQWYQMYIHTIKLQSSEISINIAYEKHYQLCYKPIYIASFKSIIKLVYIIMMLTPEKYHYNFKVS